MSQLLKSALFAAIIAVSSSTSGHAEPKHAIAMHGEPALPADFSNFPYANPDAPKGGEAHYGVIGSFDSLYAAGCSSAIVPCGGPPVPARELIGSFECGHPNWIMNPLITR